jgi:hypothetical protein
MIPSGKVAATLPPTSGVAMVRENRSDLIHSAVEHILIQVNEQDFEAKLSATYQDNAKMNRELGEEFTFVDRAGF